MHWIGRGPSCCWKAKGRDLSWFGWSVDTGGTPSGGVSSYWVLRRGLSGPLSAKLFKIVVDAVVREWIQQLQQDGGCDDAETAVTLATFFAIF